MEVTPHTPITSTPEPSLEATQEPKIKQEPIPEGPITSAHHASGNLCIENAVQRIKNAIGARKIDDSYDDILALNHGNPYHKSVLTDQGRKQHLKAVGRESKPRGL